MRKWVVPALVLLLAASGASRADDPPAVEHQPALCTEAGKPLSLCAAISDDGKVATARLYFRRAGEDYYAFVAMAFTGVSYCGTLPGAAGEDEGDRVLHPGRGRRLPTAAHEHLPSPRPAGGRLRVPPLEKDRGEGGGHQGHRDEPQAGEEARRRLQRDRRHVCPDPLGRPPSPSSSPPPPARAEAVLDVSGSVVSTSPRLEVRVVVTNRGDRPAVPARGGGRALRRAAQGPARRGRRSRRLGGRAPRLRPRGPAPGPPRARRSCSSTRSKGHPTAPATRPSRASGRGSCSRSGRTRRPSVRLAADAAPPRRDGRPRRCGSRAPTAAPHRVRVRALHRAGPAGGGRRRRRRGARRGGRHRGAAARAGRRPAGQPARGPPRRRVPRRAPRPHRGPGRARGGCGRSRRPASHPLPRPRGRVRARRRCTGLRVAPPCQRGRATAFLGALLKRTNPSGSPSGIRGCGT